MSLLWSTGLIVIGAALVVYGVELVMRGSSVLGRRARLSEFAFGMTVAAFITSAPEIAINGLHAVRGGEAIVVGNILGSNMFNVLAVLGFAALTGKIRVNSAVIRRTVPVLGLLTLALFPLFWDRSISRGDGVILALAALAYVAFTIQDVQSHASDELAKDSEDDDSPTRLLRWFGLGLSAVLAGALVVVAGGESLDDGLGGLAATLAENPTLYGISVLAILTSLPEVALGINAFAKGQTQLLAGTVLGSCVFNISVGFGTTSLTDPMRVPVVGLYAIGLNLASIAGCLGLLLLGRRLSQVVGGTMMATYLVFIGWLVFETMGNGLATVAMRLTVAGCFLPLAVASAQWLYERATALRTSI